MLHYLTSFKAFKPGTYYISEVITEKTDPIICAGDYEYGSYTISNVYFHDIHSNSGNSKGCITVTNSAGRYFFAITNVCAYNVSGNDHGFLYLNTNLNYSNFTTIACIEQDGAKLVNYIESQTPCSISNWNVSKCKKTKGTFLKNGNHKIEFCNFDSAGDVEYSLCIENNINVLKSNFLNSESYAISTGDSNITECYFLYASYSYSVYTKGNPILYKCYFENFACNGSIQTIDCILLGEGAPTNLNFFQYAKCQVTNYEDITWTNKLPPMTPARTFPEDCILADNNQKKKKKIAKVYALSAEMIVSI